MGILVNKWGNVFIDNSKMMIEFFNVVKDGKDVHVNCSINIITCSDGLKFFRKKEIVSIYCKNFEIIDAGFFNDGGVS